MGEKEVLLKKLKALAEKGVGGEQENAKRILDRLLKKYDIELSDLDGESVFEHEFEYSGKFEREILKHVCFKVTNGDRRIYSYTRGPGCRSKICCECTDAEAAQIRFENDFYSELWRQEIECFLTAFIIKHQLFDNKPDERPSTLSDEKRMRIFRMMRCLQDKSLTLRLEE